MNRSDRVGWISAEFERRFETAPILWSRAPGRVDLMGSHTDYNEGFVLTMAIDRDTWIAASPRLDRRVRIESLNTGGGGEFDLDHIVRDGETPWTNYIRGVAKAYQDEGYSLQGFDGLIQSTVPVGSGVSSSAALEVATAILFGLLGDWEIEPLQAALLCQQAENDFVGMRCGILDQYSSALGRAGHCLLLDCRNLTSQARPLAGDIEVVICDTQAPRELTGSEYALRRAQCEEGTRRLSVFDPGIRALRDVSLDQLLAHQADLPDLVFRRCRFVIEENQRVQNMAASLSAGDRPAIQTLTHESYAGARDLYKIISAEMTMMIEAIHQAPGVIGARQAGAGFGGCMVSIIEPGRLEAFQAHVSRHYTAASGIEPVIFPVHASEGAAPLKVSK